MLAAAAGVDRFIAGAVNGKSRARDQAPVKRERTMSRRGRFSVAPLVPEKEAPNLQTKSAAPFPDPSVPVLMGVSGSGKSTVALMLAHRLNWIFEEGDWFHPPSNIEKMHSGVPLTDEDRWPWLHGIAAWIDATRRAGNHGIIACSALKRVYRDILVGDRPDVRLVYLKGDRVLIARRLAARDAHFMPPRWLTARLGTSGDRHPTDMRTWSRSFRIRARSSRGAAR